MNITKIQTFITLAKCLNFTEAAEKLHCSQPSVSMQIQSLEDSLGVPLFDRIGKKLYLTKHGEQFLPYAEQILNLFHFSKEHLRQLDDLSFGTLVFGSSNFVGVYLLPAILGQFNRKFPNIKINMNITSSKQLINLLELNKIEFLILSDQIPIDQSRFNSITFYHDELVLITSPSHPLAQRKDCSLNDILNEMMLMKPENSATRLFVESKFKQFGLSISNYMEIGNLEAIKQGVIHGLGIAIVSKFAIQQELERGLLCEVGIKETKFERGINYIYYKNKNLSPAAKQFIHLLDTIID